VFSAKPAAIVNPLEKQQKIDRFGPWRRCAGVTILAWSRRFEAALWAGQGLLFMRPPLSAVMGVGNIGI
jgi:hypothetical protein